MSLVWASAALAQQLENHSVVRNPGETSNYITESFDYVSNAGIFSHHVSSIQPAIRVRGVTNGLVATDAGVLGTTATATFDTDYSLHFDVTAPTCCTSRRSFAAR